MRWDRGGGVRWTIRLRTARLGSEASGHRSALGTAHGRQETTGCLPQRVACRWAEAGSARWILGVPSYLPRGLRMPRPVLGPGRAYGCADDHEGNNRPPADESARPEILHSSPYEDERQ